MPSRPKRKVHSRAGWCTGGCGAVSAIVDRYGDIMFGVGDEVTCRTCRLIRDEAPDTWRYEGADQPGRPSPSVINEIMRRNSAD